MPFAAVQLPGGEVWKQQPGLPGLLAAGTAGAVARAAAAGGVGWQQPPAWGDATRRDEVR